MDVSLFKVLSIFEGLTQEELEKVARAAIVHSYDKNSTVIFKEGDPGDSLYIISKGKVKITRENEDGRVVVLSILDKGDFFGEMSLLDGLPRSANVVSMAQTEVLIINSKEFKNLRRDIPKISDNLLKLLCERIRKLDAQIKRIFIDEYFSIQHS